MKTKITITVVVALFLVMIVLARNIRSGQNPQTKITLTEQIISTAIDNYSKQNNVKVYNWRRNMIIKTLNGSQMTEQQLSDTIDYFVTKAWQKK